jgi:hypothetical protein
MNYLPQRQQKETDDYQLPIKKNRDTFDGLCNEPDEKTKQCENQS